MRGVLRLLLTSVHQPTFHPDANLEFEAWRWSQLVTVLTNAHFCVSVRQCKFCADALAKAGLPSLGDITFCSFSSQNSAQSQPASFHFTYECCVQARDESPSCQLALLHVVASPHQEPQLWQLEQQLLSRLQLEYFQPTISRQLRALLFAHTQHRHRGAPAVAVY